MSPSKTLQVTTRDYLEKLPLELHEPILENLAFRDIIALDMYALEGGRVASALAISPAWREVFRYTYLPRKDEFQALLSLTAVAVGEHSHDITLGALNLTAWEFHAKEEAQRLNVGYNFFTTTATTITNNIQGWLGGLDSASLTYICREIPFDAIGSIFPQLGSFIDIANGLLEQGETQSYQDARQEIRLRFFHSMALPCCCQGTIWDRSGRRREVVDDTMDPMYCDMKHWDTPTKVWKVKQTKAFVDAYIPVQRKINTAKAQQLQQLVGLYHRHGYRLTKPVQPWQSRIKKGEHHKVLESEIKQLPSAMDLYYGRMLPRRLDSHIFNRPYAYLTPKDWCLLLWLRVTELHPELLPSDLNEHKTSLTKEQSVPLPPMKVVESIHSASKGMGGYYHPEMWNLNPRENSADSWWPDVAHLPRTNTHFEARLGFLKHTVAAKRVGNRSGLLLPFDQREIEWLEAFMESVKWMEAAFPRLAEQFMVSERL